MGNGDFTLATIRGGPIRPLTIPIGRRQPEYALAEQGIDSYTGYGWYRLKLQPQQLAQISSPASGQRFRWWFQQQFRWPNRRLREWDRIGPHQGNDGVAVGVPVSTVCGPVQCAERRAGSGCNSYMGRAGNADHPRAAARCRTWRSSDMAARHSMASDTSGTNMSSPTWWWPSCLFVLRFWVDFSIWRSVIIIEYLWLALLCLSVAAGGAADSAFGLGDHAARRFTGSLRHFTAASSWPLRWSLFFTSQGPVRGSLCAARRSESLVLPFITSMH